jgi:hypothetical protein
MIVRPAAPDDVDALGQIHVRAWQAAYRGVMPDAYLDALDPGERAAMWARFFEHGADDRRLRVIVDDDIVVGFACFAVSHPADGVVPGWSARSVPRAGS